MQAYLDKVYTNVWAKIWNIFSLGLHVYVKSKPSTAAGPMARDIHYNVLINVLIKLNLYLNSKTCI